VTRVHAIAAHLPRTSLVEAARIAIVTACALALALAGPVLPNL
jgi:hypothetical protein